METQASYSTTTTTPRRVYGWERQLPDFRDLRMSAPPAEAAASFPPKFDVLADLGPVFDQKSLGSCTANSSGEAMLWSLVKQAGSLAALGGYSPSRLDIYYNSRAAEGTVKTDSGAALRDVIKVLAKSGAADERLWPYDVTKFAVKPIKAVVQDAAKHLVTRYVAVDQTLAGIKSCLVSTGPFVFGFSVYTSFESDTVARTGLAPLPKSHESLLGGHAVLCVGYDDSQKFPDGSVGGVLCRNSWGASWGQSGNFWLQYAYLLNHNLASDFWCIEAVSFPASVKA